MVTLAGLAVTEARPMDPGCSASFWCADRREPVDERWLEDPWLLALLSAAADLAVAATASFNQVGPAAVEMLAWLLLLLPPDPKRLPCPAMAAPAAVRRATAAEATEVPRRVGLVLWLRCRGLLLLLSCSLSQFSLLPTPSMPSELSMRKLECTWDVELMLWLAGPDPPVPEPAAWLARGC